MGAPASPPRISPLLMVALALGGLFVVVVGGAVVLVLSQTSAIAERVASNALPRLSREVGYGIRMKGIEGRVFPVPSVEVSDVVVAGAADEPPLLVARQLRATVELWPLIRSLGREAHFSSATVEDAVISVVTRRDGSSNLAGLVDYWGTRAGGKPSWELGSAAFRSARLVLHDLRPQGGSPIHVDGFEVDFEPHGSHAELQLRGRLAADKPNLDAKLSLDGSTARGTFTASGIDLARLRAALPGQSAEIISGGQASLSGQMVTDAKGVWVVIAAGKVHRMMMANEAVEAAFELRTTVDLGPSAPAPIELVSLTADRFVIGLLEVKNIHARATATRETFHVVGMTGQLAGGAVNVAEARLDLRSKELPWTLRAVTDNLDMIELGRALQIKMPITGKAFSTFEGSGAGVKWDTLRPSLAGTGRFEVKQPVVAAATSAMLTHSIRNTLNTFALGGLFPDLGPMSVAPFGAPFHVEAGVLTLDGPVVFAAQIGDAALKGTIGLDQKLALAGSATLRWTPLVGMKAHAATVPIVIRGTLSSPIVEVTATPARLLGAIAGAAPTLPELEAEAKRRLKDWLGGKRP